MTPDERAERICEIFRRKHLEGNGCACREIAAEIRAAVEDTIEIRFDKTYDMAYAEGSRNAYEAAAKIAEFHSGPSIQLAQKIRARAKGTACDQYHCGHEACNERRSKEMK